MKVLNNGNASKAGAASGAVNINRGLPGHPLSARPATGVGMAPNTLLGATKGMTTNSTKGISKSVLNGNVSMSKASSTGGRVASMPKGYKKGA